MPTPRAARAAIRAALEAAREGDRSKDLHALLSGVVLRVDGAAPRDELWLAAEISYRGSRYAEALELFRAFAARPGSTHAPAWQRYLAAHRRSFSALQLGRGRDAQAALDEGQQVIDHAPELARYQADLDAMRAHLAELRGDFEGAVALFERAYASAVEHGNPDRARTVASDLGRVALILKRASDGLRWFKTARDVPGSPSEHVLQTIALREAIAHDMQGLRVQALHELSSLIAACSGRGELAVDALPRRADVYRELGRLAEAERDLVQAIAAAREGALVRHELYAHKDLAALHHELHRSNDAAREFRTAIELALALDPPSLLTLEQLLADVLETPALVNADPLPARQREEMERLIGRLHEAAGESAYQRGTRRLVRTRVEAAAVRALSRFLGQRVALLTCTVDVSRGIVHGAQGAKRLTTAELAVLRVLLSSPDEATSAAIGTRLDHSLQAVEKTLSRMRPKLYGSLKTQRRGRMAAVHYLAHAKAPPTTPELVHDADDTEGTT
jgi:tetratricopeptide (TPR) repeat protein